MDRGREQEEEVGMMRPPLCMVCVCVYWGGGNWQPQCSPKTLREGNLCDCDVWIPNISQTKTRDSAVTPSFALPEQKPPHCPPPTLPKAPLGLQQRVWQGP